jgi:hypothetical protein
MKYLVAMYGDAGPMLEARSKEWVTDMIAYMQALDVELRERGELVDAQGLSDSTEAKVVSLRDGDLLTTDGPYAEAKESIIGYWVLDVDSWDRLQEICRGICTYSGSVEVRPIPAGPPQV